MMSIQDYAKRIAQELGFSFRAIENTLKLLLDGASIPFVARYRKEATGGLDEVKIAEIRDLYNSIQELEKRRETILNTIREQGKLSKELESSILSANSLVVLEDLYLPYRPKRRTRASMAIEKGLEPLAELILKEENIDIEDEALSYVSSEKEIDSVEDALAGARDIIAERVNEDSLVRERIRRYYKRNSIISSKLVKAEKEKAGNYKNYFSWSESALKSPSHRVLAMYRGEEEGFLRLRFLPEDEDKAIEIIEKLFIRYNNQSSEQIELAIRDSYKRLLSPSMENEIKSMLKEKADEEAIRVFAENLEQLLMAPALGEKRVLAIDPGFRSGCKIVCLDESGKLLYDDIIYPHSSVREERQAITILEELVKEYDIEAIGIGNGTAGRETEFVVRKCNFEKEPIITMVNESGASVYSASEAAREEFEDYDLTVRGAVSIGRRLMDPLAELVKIDPKSIGVGQYQHDVNQTKLQKALEDTVINCVNQVGVDLNTASKELLTYVSGLGDALARNIIDYRNENGAFTSRQELMEVRRFGEKAFEQSAGFLRIRNAENPLDSSAVHPESYEIVERMAASVSSSIEEIIKDREKRESIKIKDFITDKVGFPTLEDIIRELEKPGRDIREEFEVFEYNPGINRVEDIEEGMILNGIVTNITAFGAFVDIGVHQDGLVHISQIANRFIKDPADVLKLNQKVRVKVVGIELNRNRISLSIKDAK